MGRFFLGSNLFRGDVPTVDGFRQIEHLLRQELACNEIVASALFGSVAAKTHNARSDCDVIVIAKAGAGWRLHQSRLVGLCRQAQSHHVPLQLIVLDEDEAQRPHHSVRAGLYAHLINGSVPLTGIAPVHEYLNRPEETSLAEAQEYLSRKRDRLQKDVYAWEGAVWSERCHALERATEGPMHLARKCVHALTDEIHTDKQAVLEAFADAAIAFGGAQANSALIRLTELNAEYTSSIFTQPFKPHSSAKLQKEFDSVVGYETYLEHLWGKISRTTWEFYTHAKLLLS